VSRKKPGTVRIIGGRWRGRRLPVTDLPGLRPSGDRSRETLFNWLQGVIRGARCVDLFAGTGVLGLEAASRGAARVVLVERAVPAVRAIEEAVAHLRGEAAESAGPELQVRRGNALRWLETCEAASIDIAFVDPPFGAGLETRVFALLGERACLAPGGLVYLETARQAAPPLPAGWRVVREKVLGDVRMQLLEFTSAPPVSDAPDTPE
jgi:16S rRNA (guanine966-N2)-methyltransferase